MPIHGLDHVHKRINEAGLAAVAVGEEHKTEIEAILTSCEYQINAAVDQAITGLCATIATQGQGEKTDLPVYARFQVPTSVPADVPSIHATRMALLRKIRAEVRDVEDLAVQVQRIASRPQLTVTVSFKLKVPLEN